MAPLDWSRPRWPWGAPPPSSSSAASTPARRCWRWNGPPSSSSSGLFMVVGGVEKAGLLEDIGQGMGDASGGHLWAGTMLVLWPGALLSGIVDNIPFTAAMIPVVEELGQDLGVQRFGRQPPLVGAGAGRRPGRQPDPRGCLGQRLRSGRGRAGGLQDQLPGVPEVGRPGDDGLAGAGHRLCVAALSALEPGLVAGRGCRLLLKRAPVAQLDRAPASGAGCVGSSPAGGTMILHKGKPGGELP